VPGRFISASVPERSREPLLGTLQVGAPGDAAVLELEEGEFEFVDCADYRWTGPQRLKAVSTVREGRVWGRPYPHPYIIP
jgi:dihydroorotase